MNTNRMLGYLPGFISNSGLIKNTFNTYNTEFTELDNNLNNLLAQLSIDTATWALDIYEKELNIKSNYTKPLEERRNIIKSKWRGLGKADRTLIKYVADAFTNGEVEVSFIEGKINIKFTSFHGMPPNTRDLYKTIEEIVPAHLRVIYEITFNTYGYLKGYHVGWLNAFTMEELRNLRHIPLETESLAHDRLENFNHEQLEVILHGH